jgi:hypothetical protein
MSRIYKWKKSVMKNVLENYLCWLTTEVVLTKIALGDVDDPRAAAEQLISARADIILSNIA